ncbi:MAG: CDP-glycerol glycerophosphotransferase family protein, partial [Rhodanobacteraceae bacterium]
MAGIIGWLLIAPIALLMPRRRDRIVVIGMGEGNFTDNAKYFFLQSAPLLDPGVKVVFLAGSEELAAQLVRAGLATARYPSWRGIRLLLRSSVAVVDSGFWLIRMRRFLLIGAKTVQLWHGVGFKRVGVDKMRHEPRAWLSSPLMMRLRMLNGALNGKLVRYDLMASPSTFYEREVFGPAFPSNHHLVVGYPRNTFGRFDVPALRES